MQVIGIDGWKGRWVGVIIDQRGYVEAKVFDKLEQVTANKKFQAIAVDVPIGLPEQPPRLADVLVRSRLGRLRSSVFMSPPAFCLEDCWETYSQANAESRRRFNIGISAQSFALMKNIREAHRLADQDPRVHEVHPEFSFFMMNQENPLQFSKKSWNGRSERLGLLNQHRIDLPNTLDSDVGRVPIDDILDAAGAAWSALRIARDKSIAVPNAEERLHRIWA